MKQLGAQDSQFLYMETGNNLAHVTGVSVYDPSTAPGGKVRFKDIIEHMKGRLDSSPVFRRRLVRVPFELDYPYWAEDEYFDIEYHIRHGRLPEPGDWRQFCIHLARYHSRPLDMQRPLWEMFVIEGLDRVEGMPPGSYAIATKLHHAAVDGASAIRFFGALSDIDARGTPAYRLGDSYEEPGRAPALPDMMGRAFLNNVKSPIRFAETLLRAAPALYGAARKVVGGDSSGRQRVPDTRFNRAVSPHKMFDAAIFELADFKAIKKAVEGATINDVVLAICSGGLRHYLQKHNELPDESAVAWVPINARAPQSASTESKAAGNNISAMTVPIGTDIEDPVARLRAITATTQETKAAKAGLSARLMTDLSKHVPGATMALASRLILKSTASMRVCNLFISNVPGPQTALYMNGARMIHSLGMAPLADGMGLFIATPSYNGEMAFNVTSTREVLPDIEFFMDCLRKSFAELQAATVRQSSKTKTKSNKKTKRAIATRGRADGTAAAG